MHNLQIERTPIHALKSHERNMRTPTQNDKSAKSQIQFAGLDFVIRS